MEHAIKQLHCPACHADWLVLRPYCKHPPDCPTCGLVAWTVRATWRGEGASWWPMIDGRLLKVESPTVFLRRLRWCERKEHPSGPIGSRVLHLGMALVPTTEANGDTGWHFARCAGSDN
jgi:hypothetical protein